MKTFNRKRFCNAMIWLTATRLHDVLKLTIGFAVFFFFLFLWVGTARADGHTDLMLLNSSALGIFYTVCGLVLTFSGSFVTNDMRTNQERVNVLMLPASNLEKFVSRCLFALLSSVVSLFVALVAADVCQLLFRLVSGGGCVSMTWLALTSFAEMTTGVFFRYSFEAGVTMLLTFFTAHSFYVLGGTLFRRNQWILTTAMSFVLFNVMGWISAIVLPYAEGNIFAFSEWLRSVSENNPDKVVYCGLVISNLFMLALTTLYYWLAYRLFCRIQLKNNKWTNL